jgi:hypothetical protein
MCDVGTPRLPPGFAASDGVPIFKSMGSPLAILVAGIIVAAAIAFVFRWQIIPAGGDAYRLDRWSGRISICASTDFHSGSEMVCDPR